MATKILELRDLNVRFATEDGVVHAVRGIDYDLERGETIGVVGESGSGKSVSHLAVMDLLPETAEISADVLRFDGRDLNALDAGDRRALRGRELAMVFQDPMTSLNPFLTLGTQIAEMFKLHRGLRGKELERAAIDALAEVGIPKPELRVEQYPHEFSGGMRQRAMIAMMLAARPTLLIADEPTTALDVTVQAQILELLAELQKAHGMSIVLITHDLGVVAGFVERVLVMYAGRIVEEATTEELYANPLHPYTRGLLASVPRLDREITALEQIPGSPPDLAELDQGCPFRDRCTAAIDRCAREEPPLEARGAGTGQNVGQRRVACWVELPAWEGQR